MQEQNKTSAPGEKTRRTFIYPEQTCCASRCLELHVRKQKTPAEKWKVETEMVKTRLIGRKRRCKLCLLLVLGWKKKWKTWKRHKWDGGKWRANTSFTGGKGERGCSRPLERCCSCWLTWLLIRRSEAAQRHRSRCKVITLIHRHPSQSRDSGKAGRSGPFYLV